MDLDFETSHLILDAYFKINTLQKLLDTHENRVLVDFLESGKNLNTRLNNLLNSETPEHCVKKIKEHIGYANRLLAFNEANYSFEFSGRIQIVSLLREIITSLQQLELKIATPKTQKLS